MSFRFEKEIFQKKNFKKFWWFKNLPYLCIRFPKESHKEEFFERFRYKQASSTRFVIKTKNRNRQYLISKDTDSVLEQIKTSIAIWKKIFYNEEFDPGSG